MIETSFKRKSLEITERDVENAPSLSNAYENRKKVERK